MKHNLVLLIFIFRLMTGVVSVAQYYNPNTTVILPSPDSAAFRCNVIIAIDHYFPYCGGAYPTDDQMNNYQKIVNAPFLLIDLDTGEKQTVKTNTSGELVLNLKPGRYGLKETFKDCSFEKFMEHYTIESSDYYADGGIDCYKNWWASNFLEFTVTAVEEKQTLRYTFSDQCFTGNNPCISYMGPYPP